MATPPTFTAGAILTAAQMNQIGAWRTATATAAGTATTLTVSNCFTTDMRNYRIFISGSSAVAGVLTFQLTSAGTAVATNYYWNRTVLSYTVANTTEQGSATTSIRVGQLNTGALGASSNLFIDVLDPYVSTPTLISSVNQYSTANGGTTVGSHYAAASYDGFKLTGAGNLTLAVSVFGFNA